jgi:hypothetical protein
MAEFNAAHAMHDASQRYEQIASGDKLVPVSAAVIAVFAALATLFAHHSSTSALAQKNEAILYQSKAADQYNYYESKRIKVQLNQALIDAGLARNGTAGRRAMEARMKKENTQAATILKKAQALDAASVTRVDRSERFLNSYENHEVAATLFEVSIVLVSVTALMRSKVLLLVAGGAMLVGLGFFTVGLLH